MLNRRHLRIKILHILYGFYQDSDADIVQTRKALNHSIGKMQELYLLLLMMIGSMQGFAIDRIEAGRKKQLPAPEDLHPNTKFVTNKPLRALANSKALAKAANELGVGWGDDQEMLRKMFRSLLEQEEYMEYMSSEERGFKHDREYLIRMFRKHMITSEVFQERLEEQSIFWNDDLDLAASMAIKTIKTIRETDDDIELLPLWRQDDDDKEFFETLFAESLAQAEANEALVTEAAKNWELERIALMDRILMKMALAEAKCFSSIPLKVTLNEYIELSKYYSTPKSHGFINGILDQLFTQLKKDGTIVKIGRGLIE
ncbi:MAG: transcription antitermination factor NusB [Bacteroidetes bacterium]|jgi:transcription antitermination protein NusB|nr:transcription antitermination factor NusB [Bacteroidota bacterium]